MIRAFAVVAGMGILCDGQAFAQAESAKGPQAKADVEKAKGIVTQVCAACHGADGNSTAPANPKLAGQFPEYLKKQLSDFKAQAGKKPARVNAIMNGMVANLSTSDMENLAAYFSGQKLKPAIATDKELAMAGRKLWRGGNAATGVPACAGCHGPAGAGIPGEYPHLAGQYADYVVSQLKAFRDGGRVNDPNGMMRGVTAHMSEQEIRAVAQYVAGLR
jgi:cytochrome c553